MTNFRQLARVRTDNLGKSNFLLGGIGAFEAMFVDFERPNL